MRLFELSSASGSVSNVTDAFLKDVKRKGWQNALIEHWGKNSDGYKRATSPNRVTFKYLFELNRDSQILDIGAGTGGIACRLAKDYHVFAIDKLQYNIDFLKLRAQQENLKLFNAEQCLATDLVFNDNTFDLVVMVGVLEWVGNKEAQEKTLKEAHRVLKDNGNIFFGIENAQHLGYYFGVKEPHTGIKYISLLDRGEAATLSHDIRKQPYTELTYSGQEYLKLLNSAGFRNIQTYWLYPDYAFINYIVPINAIRYFIDEHILPPIKNKEQYIMMKYMSDEFVSNHVQFYGFVGCK